MAGGPPRHPCSDTGRLESDIHRLESEARRKADSHEITTLNSNVADLARAVREVSSVCTGLCSRIEVCEEKIEKAYTLGYDAGRQDCKADYRIRD